MEVKKINTICFGGEDWWYHNHGHVDMQLIRRMANLGPTLYINSIVMQKPRVFNDKRFFEKLSRKLRSIFNGVKDSGEKFWVYSPFSLPLHHLRIGRWLNRAILKTQLSAVQRKLRLSDAVVWVHCPAACEAALGMKKRRLVYLRTDRYEEFPNVDSEVIGRYDRRLKADADLTIFVNHGLYDAEAGQCKKAIYLDHGVDYESFAGAEDNPMIPAEMKDITRPIAGYFGGIDGHTFDLEFMEKVVNFAPDISFVFIGKTSQDCSKLAARENVKMLGQKAYEMIPQYGKCFDVAIMPWKQNRWIEACNPIKLKEYLALGKPVISTPFPELSQYRDVVYEAGNPQEFVWRIFQALKENNAGQIAARRAKVCGASWDSKAEKVLEELFNGSLKQE